MKNKFSIIALLGLIAVTSCGGSSSDSVGSGNTSTQVSTSIGASTSTAAPDTTYIEGNYQYFIQGDSSANRSFMRTPYIANVTSSAPSSYYANAQGKTGSALKTALKSIISNPETSYAWGRYEEVDKDPHSSNNVWCIYVRDSYGKSAHVSGNASSRWNREHTYPQSKLSGNADKDSQLIFADDWKTNNIRDNDKYGIVAHNSNTIVRDSANRVTANWSSGSYFEPCNAAKGEVARATLYTYVLYDEPIADNFTSLALCLQWNKDYPPTSWEMLRNNRNYDIQKNRNPFIDHPEYADLLF